MRTELRQCPYCLGEFPDAERTDDHVIARSWFPAKTPPVAKWQVRSCRGCNNQKGAVEGDLLGRLALCLDPDDPALAEIIERARRSMNPRSARTARDFKHRFNRREAILSSVIDVHSKSDADVLPYFAGNFDAGSRSGIKLDAQALDGLVEKWVRGIHRCEVGRIIPSGYEVSVIHVDDEVRDRAFSGVMERAKVIQKGPGVEVAILHAEKTGEFGALYAFNTLKFTVSVARIAEAGPSAP